MSTDNYSAWAVEDKEGVYMFLLAKDGGAGVWFSRKEARRNKNMFFSHEIGCKVVKVKILEE